MGSKYLRRMARRRPRRDDGVRRVLIAAGGTGGHIAPALAVGSFLRERWDEGVIVRFVTGSRKVEGEVFDAADEFPERLACDKPPRLAIGSIPAIARYVGSVAGSLRVLARFQPDVVLGMGGYVCAPVLLAAWLRGIPFYMHESNAVPGLVTRMFARSAREILVGCEAAAHRLPPGTRTRVVGTPVRPELLECTRGEAAVRLGLDPELPTVLVLGGSQGALALNEAVVDGAATLGQRMSPRGGVQVLLACGQKHVKTVTAGVARCDMPGTDIRVFEYIADMAAAYAAADVVVSRAGASTLAELAALGKPAFLVPYPHAKDNHQAANARALASVGAAEVIEEDDLAGVVLAEQLASMLSDDKRREALAAAALAAAIPDATERIASLLAGQGAGSAHGAGAPQNPARRIA